MKKKLNRSAVVTVILFVLAISLLLFSTIGGTMAALTYYSETYSSQLSMLDIGITLNENGDPVSRRDYTGEGNWNEDAGTLLTNMLPEGEKIVLGKKYDEALSVTNSGSIDEYVRVTIYKYWLGPDGKDTMLSPELIHLNLIGNGWIVDEEYSDKPGSELFRERTILYYTKPLAVGDTTPDLSDTLMIDDSIASKVLQEITTQENGYTKVTTVYEYDGVQFVIEAEADGVQTHNAADAIKSAWGRDVNIAGDGTLSLS